MLNLSDFYDPNSIREYLRLPIIVGDHIIATNGHIALITKSYDFDFYNSAPEVVGLLVKRILTARDSSIFSPLPENLIYPDKINCLTCHGTGKCTAIVCWECGGESVVNFSTDVNDYEFICKSCNGSGELIIQDDNNCPICLGKGFYYHNTSHVDVTGVFVNPNYLNLIIDEPDISVAAWPNQRVLNFKTAEQCGLIMGLNI